MADKKMNRGLKSNSSQDWDNDRNRYGQDSDWTQNRNKTQQFEDTRNRNENYRDVGYSGDSVHGMGEQDPDRSNRVNYFPDNDENRGYQDRDYENTQYGTSGTYGYRDDDQRRSGNDRSSRYGNAGSTNAYGGQGWNQDRNRRDDDYNQYGNRYNSGNDWNSQRRQSGDDWNDPYRRQDWGRAHVNTGNENRDRYDRDYRDDDRNNPTRNRYGGDTRNYGNANQGGITGKWWEKTKDKVSDWFRDDDDDNRERRDRSGTGGYRGKGPADYRRSQDRIREDICDRLTDDDRVDATHISVKMDDDAVILSGTVSSRDEKRRAEDLVESVSGVRNVENRLRVAENAGWASHEYTGNTDRTGGIGTESGTTNEIIRNVENERTPGRAKGKNRNS